MIEGERLGKGLADDVACLVRKEELRVKRDDLDCEGGALGGTRFYNNAAKIFGTEGVLCRRFVNFAIKRCLKQAGIVVFTMLPA